mmetsp:Transcript_27771/g.44413  ORF Transcript_27771/g.44413 Transcript_27771/m.44413 type:complete len:88 (-) Transcript_27771:318-581(-)
MLRGARSFGAHTCHGAPFLTFPSAGNAYRSCSRSCFGGQAEWRPGLAVWLLDPLSVRPLYVARAAPTLQTITRNGVFLHGGVACCHA